MKDDASFDRLDSNRTITWITHVDSKRMWADFAQRVDSTELPQTASPGCNTLVPLRLAKREPARLEGDHQALPRT